MDSRKVKYAKSDEWVSVEGETATIGISDFAVNALTDLVYLDLPAAGRKLGAGEAFGVVESVKAASDLYSPVAGEVVASNTALADQLDKLSSDPFGDGWLIKVRLASREMPPELMDRAAYEKHWASRAH
ncbi:MAG: glycine cleavage system protein GcvH [Planctomycetaceae bacterium]